MKPSTISTAIGTVVLTYVGAAAALAQADSERAIANLNQQTPRIQLAILLDTSNSMDGLIDQTRNQLWTMVDELASAKQNGRQPQLEVAVFEYGNDSISAQQGHIRKRTALTTELDRVSEALFSLTTNGGSEYCGQAIDTALSQLQWSRSPNDLRLIFIAGNEPFTQGPVAYADAIERARARDIAVSTIFAGEHAEGVATGWQQGAALAGGNFMSINHNYRIAHIDAPQDQRIAELNAQLNQTYVPYGREGQAAAARQSAQDEQNAAVSGALLAKRAKAKASKLYKNTQWDLVDAHEAGEVALEELAPQDLPAPMVDMNKEERQAYIAEKKAEREAIQEEIQDLSEARNEFLAEERQKQAETAEPTVNEAVVKSIREQAGKKAYTFE